MFLILYLLYLSNCCGSLHFCQFGQSAQITRAVKLYVSTVTKPLFQQSFLESWFYSGVETTYLSRQEEMSAKCFHITIAGYVLITLRLTLNVVKRHSTQAN